MPEDNVKFKKIVDHVYNGVYLLDKDRKITYWNKGAEDITGFLADEVRGTSCSKNILVHVDEKGQELCQGLCPVAATLEDNKSREASVFLHHKNGHRVPVSVRITAVRDKHDNNVGAIEIFTDISDKNAVLRIKELEKLAMIDQLTKLPNRNYIDNELIKCFEEKKRYQMSFGIIFADIDYFKTFNDNHGHLVGDKILKVISQTFLSNARPFDLIGRWGGEEFVCIIRNINTDQLNKIGNKYRLLVEKTFIDNNGNNLNVTISMGASLAKDNDTIETLIKRADALLYQSKSSGRNRLTIS